MNFTQSPSPNKDSRRGYHPEAIVIHCTDGNWPSDKEWLRSPRSQVSSHYIIAPTGEIHQLVPDEERAWHAGRYAGYSVPLKKNLWGGVINPNRYTIGIEVSLKPPALPTSAQNFSLRKLISYLSEKWSIPLDRSHIWKHNEIFSGKTCPHPIDVDNIVSQARTPNREDVKKQIKELVDKL